MVLDLDTIEKWNCVGYATTKNKLTKTHIKNIIIPFSKKIYIYIINSCDTAKCLHIWVATKRKFHCIKGDYNEIKTSQRNPTPNTL